MVILINSLKDFSCQNSLGDKIFCQLLSPFSEACSSCFIFSCYSETSVDNTRIKQSLTSLSPTGQRSLQGCSVMLYFKINFKRGLFKFHLAEMRNFPSFYSFVTHMLRKVKKQFKELQPMLTCVGSCLKTSEFKLTPAVSIWRVLIPFYLNLFTTEYFCTKYVKTDCYLCFKQLTAMMTLTERNLE